MDFTTLPYLKVKQYAQLTQCRTRQVYDAIEAGKLEHIKVGGSIRIKNPLFKEQKR